MPDPLEDRAGYKLLEQFDGFAPLRGVLRKIADQRNDWAGIPMPIGPESPLVIEPNYPNAKELMAICQPSTEETSAEQDNVRVRNVFWSDRLHARIYIFEEEGKIKLLKEHIAPHHLQYDLQTLGASYAWGVEQESRAVHLLATLVRHNQLKHYLLTGMFLEKSHRSGLTYLFRKLRPTVVLNAREGNGNTTTRILCALCLHPIGYYQGSYAGAMAPTDDVVAHLMLMRGDEHMFWKRSSQHHPGRPEAGL